MIACVIVLSLLVVLIATEPDPQDVESVTEEPIQPVPKSHRLPAAVLFCLALFLTGCVSSKYQAASALNAQPQWMNLALEGAPLGTQLDAVIAYQGPGSWKKSAYWDEFLLTFTNDTDEPVTLTAASVIDYFGAALPAGTDPWKLETASRLQRDRYLHSGVNFALNTLGYVAFTYGAVGAGAMAGAALTNTWGGAMAGATAGVVAVPVTAVVIYVNNRKHRRAIENEFNRRRLALPLVLRPRETRGGSLFFPVTVSPQSFRLESKRGGQLESSLLPLPMLSGLHRKASSAAGR